jgi:ADP-heptose:LPS heptosyltransferase
MSKGINGQPEIEENPEVLNEFFDSLRAEDFDLVIQIHDGGRRTNPLVLRMGARLTAGLKIPDAVSLDLWVPYFLFQPEILRCLEVVALVGAVPTVLEPRIAVTQRDLEEAAMVVPPLGAPIVALHPGANDLRRRWPPSKFAFVGDKLAAAGAHVVITGVPSEQALVDEVCATMKAKAQDLCGQISLGGLTGVLSQSMLLVSNDTGPLHLAAAVGTRTVGIYWGWNLFNYGPLTRSRHRPIVSWRFDCPICGADQSKESCDHRESLVAEISEYEVAQLALEQFTAELGKL